MWVSSIAQIAPTTNQIDTEQKFRNKNKKVKIPKYAASVDHSLTPRYDFTDPTISNKELGVKKLARPTAGRLHNHIFTLSKKLSIDSNKVWELFLKH